MEFSRQEYWSGLPFPSPGDLPDPGVEPGCPTLQADSLPSDSWGKPYLGMNSKLTNSVVIVSGESEGTQPYIYLYPFSSQRKAVPTNVQTTTLMLKILQVRLQQYMNREYPDVQLGFRKGRGIRDQIANICWIIGKAREFQKNICFCFIDYTKAFDSVDHSKLWKILKEMGIPDHLTYLPPEKSVCKSRMNS